MSGRGDIEPLFSSELPPGEDEDVIILARRLQEERPLPRAGFRAQLRRQLVEDVGKGTTQAVRIQIAAYAGSGIALLAIAAVGLVGVGPLAAG